MDGQDDNPFAQGFAQLTLQIAQVMLQHEMTIAEGTELLKKAMVEAALLSAGPKATDSHVALVTGVHRKDVKRLRATEPDAPKRSNLGAAATVLSVWATNAEFLTDGGAPMALLRRGTDQERGFDNLVRAAKVDLPPATVLAHVIADGAVTEAQDKLVLTRASLGLGEDAAAKLEAFTLNAAAHLAAGAANLADGDHFERALHVNRLSATSVARLQQEAALGAQDVLARLNRLALDLQDQDEADRKDATGRIAIGAYVYGQRPKGDEE